MGDKIGRGVPLKMVLIIVALPTILIGLLPTYHDIGLLAPTLLLAFRLIQGFAMGAEYPMNACYIFETSPIDRRSVLCSIVAASQVGGILLASLITFLLFQYFDREKILAWAWRIPFLLSIPLTICIGYIRRNIDGSKVYRESFLNPAWGKLKWPLLKIISLNSFITIVGYTLLAWLPSYLIHFLNYSPLLAQLLNIITLTILAVFYLTAGYVAHFVGYQQMIKFGIFTGILLIIPLWLWLQKASFGIILVIQLLLTILLASTGGVFTEALAAQFPSWLRCRGMALAYTLPAVFLGGTAPLINTWGTEKLGLMFPAFYILFFGLLALPAAWKLKVVKN